ncbi:MAG TPA: hypothetical protein VFG72_05365 [Marmoricola sp.]|nr:hypothetical protein [Marmoricola sp.]
MSSSLLVRGRPDIHRPARPRRRIGSVVLVGLCVVFTVAVRLPFLGKAMMPDEAGLLLVARQWSEGPYLYGDTFIGRGLLAVAFYRLGDLLGGAIGVRLLGCLVAALLVVAAGRAGHLLGGRAGAGWAALVAASYSSTYFFSSDVTNERLLGAALVMAGCAATLSALRSARPSGWAVAAGVLAAAPVLVVQSYLDGLVFASVVLVVLLVTAGGPRQHVRRVLFGGLAGIAATVAAVVLLLAATWMTFDQFWSQMVGYRVDASVLVTATDNDRAEGRLNALLLVASLSGVLTLACAIIAGARPALRDRQRTAVWLGVAAMLAMSVASMVAGGDYWRDYLLQPIPALVLGVGLLSPLRTLSGRAVQVGAAWAAVASLLAVSYGTAVDPVLGDGEGQARVGRWLEANAAPDDTALVLWGKANVLYHAGMTSPYPFMWSLLTRTLDPDLELLLQTIRGPEAPTWVVVWSDLDTWGLDADGELREALEERYDEVGTVCGKEVLLLEGNARDVVPPEAC